MKYTFKAYERLKSRKTIQSLFTSGSVIKSYPFKLVYTPIENQAENPNIEMGDELSTLGLEEEGSNRHHR